MADSDIIFSLHLVIPFISMIQPSTVITKKLVITIQHMIAMPNSGPILSSINYFLPFNFFFAQTSGGWAFCPYFHSESLESQFCVKMGCIFIKILM